jgi:hypothetical protein
MDSILNSVIISACTLSNVSDHVMNGMCISDSLRLFWNTWNSLWNVLILCDEPAICYINISGWA